MKNFIKKLSIWLVRNSFAYHVFWSWCLTTIGYTILGKGFFLFIIPVSFIFSLLFVSGKEYLDIRNAKKIHWLDHFVDFFSYVFGACLGYAFFNYVAPEWVGLF